jgi:Tfp pilus assembly protein PilF
MQVKAGDPKAARATLQKTLRAYPGNPRATAQLAKLDHPPAPAAAPPAP